MIRNQDFYRDRRNSAPPHSQVTPMLKKWKHFTFFPSNGKNDKLHNPRATDRLEIKLDEIYCIQ